MIFPLAYFVKKKKVFRITRASASHHCHQRILTSFLIMKDNNHTLQSRTIFPAA